MKDNENAKTKLLDPQHITIKEGGYTISVEILTDFATDEEVIQIRNIAAAIAKRAAERGYATGA